MVSDDTEHTCMTAQALIASSGDPAAFATSLARRLRWWLLGLPAGTGMATLKACLKLWLGFPPQRSGVFSAGNGPAMRSAIIGVCHGHDAEAMRDLVRVSTRITHTDPKAEYGALAVALAAHMAAETDGAVAPDDFYDRLCGLLADEGADEFLALIRTAVAGANRRQSTEDFAAGLGLTERVSGYIYHTVPVAVHSWLTHQDDFRAAVVDVIRCGGDTDTTGAIAGAIVGAGVGKDGIPQEWLDGLLEWPRTVAWMETLGNTLAALSTNDTDRRSPSLPPHGILLRNVFFFVLVLIHGFRRLLPPY